MAKDDPQSVAFKLVSIIGSNSIFPTLFPDDYEVWVLHIEDYVAGIDKIGSHVCRSMIVGPHLFSKMKMAVTSIVEYKALLDKYSDMKLEEKERVRYVLKEKREICFALAPSTFRLVSSFETTFEIWEQLKEVYFSNNKQLDSLQTCLLSKFGSFKKKSGESIDQVFERYN